MLGGGGKSGCMLSKMFVLGTVPVHETSFTNQRFCSMHLSRGREYVKDYSLYACENAENYGWYLK